VRKQNPTFFSYAIGKILHMLQELSYNIDDCYYFFAICSLPMLYNTVPVPFHSTSVFYSINYADHMTPLFLQELALTLLTSLLVDIVCLRTKAMELLFTESIISITVTYHLVL
jgi:hypothetical protein